MIPVTTFSRSLLNDCAVAAGNVAEDEDGISRSVTFWILWGLVAMHTLRLVVGRTIPASRQGVWTQGQGHISDPAFC